MKISKLIFAILLLIIASISVFGLNKVNYSGPCPSGDLCHNRYYNDCCGPYNPEQHPECEPYCW